MTVVGLDLSIAATGIAVDYGPGTFTIQPRTLGDHRLPELRDRVAGHCDNATLVAIEGPVLRSQAAIALAMLHGVIRAALIDQGTPYVLVAPASLKTYATGKGNAGKPEMAVAAYKRTGIEFTDDNQCDAAWLRWMALDALGQPEFDLPASHRRALAKIAWPAINEAATA